MSHRASVRALLFAACLLATSAHAQQPANVPAATDLQAASDGIAREVAEIRGLSVKRPVSVETQTPADFGAYVSRRIDEAIPASVQKHYGTIVRTLGLYRGPPIEDFAAMMTRVMTSQVGAYYDPARRRFYVLLSGAPELAQGLLLSHELHHALQDQHFDLARYLEMESRQGARGLSADERLARQAVVEGEATYVMTLWMMQKMTGRTPPREMLADAVNLQSNMSMDQLRQMLEQPQVAELAGSGLEDALKSARDIPPFILDSMMGAYMKGLGFVFAVQEQGWSAVGKLYTDYPPQSTEHVLHPEKWLAREAAATFEWPDFDRVPALKGWQLLDDDVLGEFQWRSVFKAHGLAAEADSVAAGWGGDRYAVFQQGSAGPTLLLLRTSWDSEQEAREFAEAYRRLLSVKHGDGSTPTRLEQRGVDVFIVEGADEGSLDDLMKAVQGAKRKRG